MALQRSNANNDNDLIFNRFELACIAFLYPAWSLFLKFFFPDTFDILWQRFIIAGLFLTLFITSYFFAFVRRYVNILFYLIMNILVMHYFYLMYMSHFSVIYVIGSMVVATVSTLVIFRVIPYIIISINSLICAILVIYASNAPYVQSVMLILGLVSIQLTSLIILRSRARTERMLTETRAQLEIKNKDLIANLALTTIQKADLEKVNKELDRYVHTVSHDIRSPLMGIAGYTDLLNEDLKKKDMTPKRQHFLEGALKGIHHLNIMIDELLRTTKIARIYNPYEPVHISEIIEIIEQRLSFNLKENNTELVVQPGIPPITCDRIKMIEVFQNLISNAIKFSAKSPNPRIAISHQIKENTHLFCVQDNGIGIDKKYHEKIFKMFASASESTDPDSSGVGLHIVQKVIHDHGGKIWVESEVGKGAAFYFTVPGDLRAG